MIICHTFKLKSGLKIRFSKILNFLHFSRFGCKKNSILYYKIYNIMSITSCGILHGQIVENLSRVASSTRLCKDLSKSGLASTDTESFRMNSEASTDRHVVWTILRQTYSGKGEWQKLNIDFISLPYIIWLRMKHKWCYEHLIFTKENGILPLLHTTY